MCDQYVRIAEESDGEAIEIPTEQDGTIILSSVSAQFPGVCGLKYRNPETQTMRGVKLLDGVFYPPDTENFWKDYLYITVYPKDNKRKMEDEDSQSIRSKRPTQKCSDLIVLGLPWKVEEADLESYFKPYGELVMVMVKRDDSGKSRGYGFIRYADYEAQERVIGKAHFIEGRRCEVKIPHSKAGADEPQASNKVFVGRITESMTKNDLRTFFEQFGTVDDVFIPTPFRAFAFVTFRDSSVAQKLIGEDQVINGVSVYINNADPKGSKDNARAGDMSSGTMPYQYGANAAAGYGGARGNAQNNQRYFGNVANNPMAQFNDPRNANPFPNPMAQSSAASFNPASLPGFNSMNPAVLAAALESWNNMLSGMFAGAAQQGRAGASGWQNSDMKKDGNPGGWNGKGDAKWA